MARNPPPPNCVILYWARSLGSTEGAECVPCSCYLAAILLGSSKTPRDFSIVVNDLSAIRSLIILIVENSRNPSVISLVTHFLFPPMPGTSTKSIERDIERDTASSPKSSSSSASEQHPWRSQEQIQCPSPLEKDSSEDMGKEKYEKNGKHSKHVSLDTRLKLKERIRHFTWTWFTMTMATGGIANVLHTGKLSTTA